jgi:hypothetical protein
MDGANASRTRVRRLVPLVLPLALWGAIATGAADGAVGSRAGVDRLDFAPIASSVLTRPTPVKATDGRFHIVYEVVLTNNTPLTMGVEGFEVRDARTRRVLARLSGPTLAANMARWRGRPRPRPTIRRT